MTLALTREIFPGSPITNSPLTTLDPDKSAPTVVDVQLKWIAAPDLPLLAETRRLGWVSQVLSVMHVFAWSDDLRVHEQVSAPWFQAVLRKAPSLLSLEKNWNSHGSPPIDLSTMSTGLTLLWSLSSPSTAIPEVFPTASGGIQFEWSSSSLTIELHIDPSGEAYLFVDDEVVGEQEFDPRAAMDRARRELARL